MPGEARHRVAVVLTSNSGATFRTPASWTAEVWSSVRPSDLGRELLRADLIWVDEIEEADALIRACLPVAASLGIAVFAKGPARELYGCRLRPATSLAEACHNSYYAPAPTGGLAVLQRYYAHAAEDREYDADDPREALLLLTEEVGELAHAIREHIGMDRTRPFSETLNVSEELADVQLFVLNLANKLGVDLASSVARKEDVNRIRASSRWVGEARRTHIAIEGIIGAGKSTIAAGLALSLGGTMVRERVENQPFLREFYEDQDRYGLLLQFAFMHGRWHDLEPHVTAPLVVSDFSPMKDRLFAEMLIADPSARALVLDGHNTLWQNTPQPDLAIVLDLPPSAALKRIRSRGRHFEQGISLAYLESLRDQYFRSADQLAQSVEIVEIDELWGPDEVLALVVARSRDFIASGRQASLGSPDLD